jgi:hypothetical protein
MPISRSTACTRVVDRVYGLERANVALAALERAIHVGKLVVTLP